ncbi:MAG: hypothetical protein ACXWYS_05280 [Gaiellaceae bacterium]
MPLDTTLLRDGLYDLRATVTDRAGLSAEDVRTSVRLDTPLHR